LINQWIVSILPPKKYPKLLDLGCGAGVYAEKFYEKSYRVTGIDFSRRSIDYAETSAKMKSMDIKYHLQNYLELSVEGEFDIATLISFDFGVLSDDNRSLLLRKIHSALNPNGVFVFDVFTPKYYDGKSEQKSWVYCQSGFWKEAQHICLNSLYRYDDSNTFLNQTITITENSVDCYNIWEHTFTVGELERDIFAAGFTKLDFYGDIAGARFDSDGESICVVAQKEEIDHVSI
jgi:SAM-dependent methyltransferase